MVASPPKDLRGVMPRPVRLSEDAIVEARAAFQWYRQRSDRAAARFRDELDQAVEAIRTSPEAWPSYGNRSDSGVLDNAIDAGSAGIVREALFPQSRRQGRDVAGRVILDALQHVHQVGVRIDLL